MSVETATRIGELLVSAGLLSSAGLAMALRKQDELRARGGARNLGEVLTEMQLVDAGDVARVARLQEEIRSGRISRASEALREIRSLAEGVVRDAMASS